MTFDNQYLTFEEYQGLGGNLLEMPFNVVEYKAEKEIDSKSSNRFRKLQEYPQELKMCVYELISIIDSEDSSIVASETVGSYSVTNKSVKDINKAKYDIIKQYLSQVKIDGVFALYCGADED